ncbi:Ras-related protein Rab-2 [Armadillidium vulgare]|nr:Ras-related protein Rab-2 [Armadillidium vulgare]
MENVRYPNIIIKGTLTPVDISKPRNHVLIIGQLHDLVELAYDKISCKLPSKVGEEDWTWAVNSLSPSPTDSCSLYQNVATVAALPLKSSRHNTPSRAHSLTKLVRTHTVGEDECIVIVCEQANLFASVCAIARAYPSYSKKTSSSLSLIYTVTIEILLTDSTVALSRDEIKALTETCEGVRLAAHIVDAPANEMHTDGFIEEVKKVAEKLGLIPTIIRGNELAQKGFGGIYGVGKAALNPPALVVLSHKPQGATENIAWVGKGIVFDTGGLSMKTKTTMPGMKRDCGGAAAILGGFYAAVSAGFSQNLHAVFCLAENAVGPNATKPDDIHTLYSGRTVEINNTDAEGRLVLSDGVVYAAKDLHCSTIVDMATLTGAQGISTELHFSEFASSVADMKNSVADRSNATSSCAGLFIGAHLGFDFPGSWVHVDMASPVHSGERATGYGVALLVAMFSRMSENSLIHSLCYFSKNESNSHDRNNSSKKIRLS